MPDESCELAIEGSELIDTEGKILELPEKLDEMVLDDSESELTVFDGEALETKAVGGEGCEDWELEELNTPKDVDPALVYVGEADGKTW